MFFSPPQGCLLLYGTYLAGLTSNVSHPPVNQSPTILTVVTLVTVSSAVAVPTSTFLQAWPNLVYGAVAGAIFVCTVATNCMLFVPQVSRHWREYALRHNPPFSGERQRTAVASSAAATTPKLKAELAVGGGFGGMFAGQECR